MLPHINKFLTLCVVVLGVIIITPTTTDACSCMPEHPQSKYCNANYVILARVLSRKMKGDDDYANIVYKLDIKKKYKMTEKAEYYLKDGRISTASNSAACGIDLKLGKLYVIAGSSSHIGICNYVKEYSQMSVVERRGFGGTYNKGCSCRINLTQTNRMKPGVCNWTYSGKCQQDFGVCIPSHPKKVDGKHLKCHWRRSPPFNACLQNNV